MALDAVHLNAHRGPLRVFAQFGMYKNVTSSPGLWHPICVFQKQYRHRLFADILCKMSNSLWTLSSTVTNLLIAVNRHV